MARMMKETPFSLRPPHLRPHAMMALVQAVFLVDRGKVSI